MVEDRRGMETVLTDRFGFGTNLGRETDELKISVRYLITFFRFDTTYRNEL